MGPGSDVPVASLLPTANRLVLRRPRTPRSHNHRGVPRQQRGLGADFERAKGFVIERDRRRCQLRMPGCTSVATTADHIVPRSGGGTAAPRRPTRGTDSSRSGSRRTPSPVRSHASPAPVPALRVDVAGWVAVHFPAGPRRRSAHRERGRPNEGQRVASTRSAAPSPSPAPRPQPRSAGRQRDAHLAQAAVVELRGAPRTRPGPVRQSPAGDVEESRTDELVEMERGQCARDACRDGGLVAAEGAAGADDGVVERTPGRFIEQGHGFDSGWSP